MNKNSNKTTENKVFNYKKQDEILRKLMEYSGIGFTAFQDDLKKIHPNLNSTKFCVYLKEYKIIDEMNNVNDTFRKRGLLLGVAFTLVGRSVTRIMNLRLTEKGIEYFKILLRDVDLSRYSSI